MLFSKCCLLAGEFSWASMRTNLSRRLDRSRRVRSLLNGSQPDYPKYVMLHRKSLSLQTYVSEGSAPGRYKHTTPVVRQYEQAGRSPSQRVFRLRHASQARLVFTFFAGYTSPFIFLFFSTSFQYGLWNVIAATSGKYQLLHACRLANVI